MHFCIQEVMVLMVLLENAPLMWYNVRLLWEEVLT